MNMKSGPEASSNWDIAVACDLRLKSLFNDNPDLEGQYLDIDPEAIKEVLTEFNPAGSGKLLFTAMHGASVPLEERGAAGFLKTEKKEGDIIQARVRVGGGLSTVFSSLDDLFDQAQDDPELMRDENKASAYVIQILSGVGRKLEDDDRIQETAVHELRHVSDFTDEKLVKKEKRFHRYTSIKSVVAANTGALVTNVLFQMGFEEITDSTNSVGRVSAGLIGMLLFLRLAHRPMRAYGYKRYSSSPMERVAFATHDQAPNMPRIINIKNIQQSNINKMRTRL